MNHKFRYPIPTQPGYHIPDRLHAPRGKPLKQGHKQLMKAIIFDCDGVLVNSETLTAIAYKRVYARHGLTIAPKAFSAMLGMKQTDILANLRGEEGGLLPAEASGELTEEILSLLGQKVRHTPGLTTFMDRLDLPYCVASSSDVPRIRLSLATAGILDRFDGRIFSSSMVANGKPAPDLFLLAAERLGVDPGDCVVFEDSVAGVTAAVAAGMTPIGYIGGEHLPRGHDSKLRAAGAREIIQDWHAAESFLKRGIRS
ncbi:HAD family phosphatase [Paracoccus onubensis]|uniref:HAD family phosphatase n=2 Tax=Paracoccus onubensis TaxID=1675788 RepID=A0A418T7S8_9RHOB|nr:HAD family phosphatase [Paracoccus onubensis]